MVQQTAGSEVAAPPTTKGGVPYRIERRSKKKGGDGQLSGYALDITIRVNGQEAYFLQDHNSKRNVMPHTTGGE